MPQQQLQQVVKSASACQMVEQWLPVELRSQEPQTAMHELVLQQDSAWTAVPECSEGRK